MMFRQIRIPPLLQLIALAIAIALLILFYGCRAPAPLIAGSDTIRITRDSIIPRIDTIRLSDSAGITALLECDSMGRVRIKEVTDSIMGKYVRPKVIIRGNVLQADCIIDSAAVVHRWNEVRRIEKEKIIITLPPVKENYVKPWQWACIYGFFALAIFDLLYFSLKGVISRIFTPTKIITWIIGKLKKQQK